MEWGQFLRLTVFIMAISGIGGISGASFAADGPSDKIKRPGSSVATPATTSQTPKATAKEGKKKERKVRYKKGKRHDFDAQNIDGKLRRPEISIVSAGEGLEDNGLLRLREDFIDRITAFAGEEIK